MMTEMYTNSDQQIAGGAKHSVRRVLIVMPLFFLVAIALYAGVVTAGIYKLGWENAAATGVAALVPLPAGKVGNTTITCKQYFSREHLLQAEQLKTKSLPTSTFSELAKESYIRAFAAVNHLKANGAFVDQFMSSQFEGSALNQRELRLQAEGVALQVQVAHELRSGEPGLKLASQLSEQALAKLDSEKYVDPLAMVNAHVTSEDHTSSGSNPVPLRQLPEVVQKAFKKLKPGQTLSTPVATEVGFFVGKYIKNDAGGNPLVRYVILTPTLNQWIDEQHIPRSQHGYLPQIK